MDVELLNIITRTMYYNNTQVELLASFVLTEGLIFIEFFEDNWFCETKYIWLPVSVFIYRVVGLIGRFQTFTVYI